MTDCVGALDQGTTSTRFIVYDRDGREVARHQVEHKQILPRPGWVEHDPIEIWDNSQLVISKAMNCAGLSASDLVAVGIANQRETTVVWDRRDGRPLYNAIVWQDTRTLALVTNLEERGFGDLVRERTGLVPATYFAGGKLAWILENVVGAREAADRGDALFGTIDSWLLWRLTGQHVTDVTNASRTMLMDLRTLDWDDELLAAFDIPRIMLPRIRPSTDSSGTLTNASSGPFKGTIRIAAALGDQQAALVGQMCFNPGDVKCTYGTGNFVLMNTGSELVRSKFGLLTTLAYQFDGEAASYALEGSIAVTGAAVQWLRDQMGLIKSASEIEPLARSVSDSEGLYFVPAFSGLFAPYWRPDARGVLVGMSRFHTRAHLARATLDAIAFQTRDVVDAMASDTGSSLDELRVDGAVTSNDLCMQIQANVLGVPVARPAITETTALGAAYAAGKAVGIYDGPDVVHRHWRKDDRWKPQWGEEQRAIVYLAWQKAVERTLDWIDT